MITLESILQNLGCKKPFDKKGNFTKKGHKTFIMLEDTIYDVFELTGVETDLADAITEELFEIFVKEY